MLVQDLIAKSENDSGKLIWKAQRPADLGIDIADFFASFGFVSLRKAISPELLIDFAEEVTTLFQPWSSSEEDSVTSAIMRLDSEDRPKLQELSLAAGRLLTFSELGCQFSELVKELSGSRNPVFTIDSGILLGIPRDSRLVYDFHQESNYMRGFEEIWNVHFPIFRKSNLANGTMSVIPASHKYGTLDFEKRRKAEDSYTDLLPKGIDAITASLPELHLELDPGDVAIFSKDAIHRSNFNESEHCRVVSVYRFTQSLSGDWVRRKPDEL